MRRVFAFAGVLGLALVSGAAAAGPTLKSLESQRRAAVLDLYALDTRVATAERRLASLQREEAALRAQERALHQQLAATRGTLRVSQRQLAENLRNLYKRGNVNALAVVLGSQSLDDAVSQLDTLHAVADQNTRVATLTTRAQVRLEIVRMTLTEHELRTAAAVSAARETLATLAAARRHRLTFIARLRTRERVKATQLRALEARARHAEVKSAALRDTPPAPAAAASPDGTGGSRITVTSTGYSLPGHTATGLPVGWGVVAVDPTVIPLGTKVTIPGYGEGVAADTGGGVRGHDIDLWFPTPAQAQAWGRRTITITLH